MSAGNPIRNSRVVDDVTKPAPLARVRDDVRADYLASELDRANQQAFATAKARYTIVRADLAQQ